MFGPAWSTVYASFKKWFPNLFSKVNDAITNLLSGTDTYTDAAALINIAASGPSSFSTRTLRQINNNVKNGKLMSFLDDT